MSYYGRMGGEPPVRSFSSDCEIELERIMLQAMRDMEDRLKRHVTECKREVIKEVKKIISTKEKKDGIERIEHKGKSNEGNHKPD